jgi:hypothetical protein
MGQCHRRNSKTIDLSTHHMDDTLILVILACVILLVLVFGLFYIINQLRPIDGIKDINEKLGTSTGLGLGGEMTLETVLESWIKGNLIVKRLAMPNQSRVNVEYAYNIGKSIGQDYWVPIDNKKGGNPRKNIEDVSKKYVGKNNGSVPFTTPYGIITTNEEDYQQYQNQNWKVLAKENNIIIVKHNQILPFIEFLQWQFDKLEPQNDLLTVVNVALSWETHHEKSKELTEKITKSVDEFKKHIIGRPDKIESTIPIIEESQIDEEN